MPSPFDTLTVTLGDAPPDRLDKALAQAVPEDASLSRSRLMRMITDGAVSRDGVVLSDAKTRVLGGQIFVLRLDPAAEVDTQPEDIPLEVIWEDDDLIVINKAAGHGGASRAGHAVWDLGERAAGALW